MSWSKYQTAIFDDITNRSASLNVNAVAGSGKTTTLTECARRHPYGVGKVLAFNKIIAQELARRLPEEFDAQTFNACGFREIRSRIRNVKVNGSKLFELMKGSGYSAVSGDDNFELRGALRQTVDLMKANAMGIDGDYDRNSIATLIDNKEIDYRPLSLDQFIDLAIQLFDESCSNLTEIDFSDQLYLPIANGWRFDQWPVVFADEAQDLSPIQHLMLLRMTDNIVAFGDPHQAIYAFRGADTESMNHLQVATNAPELPLSVCYRCPTEVVREAQRYVPHIEAAPDAPTGSVEQINVGSLPADMLRHGHDENTLILCRNNKPLMRLALALLRDNRPFHILNNFPESLKKFIKSFDAKDFQQFHVRLRSWYEEQLEAYHDRPGRMAAVDDKYQSITALMEEVGTIEELIKALEAIARSSFGPRLSTIHKAKGTEARNVYFLGPELVPSRFARSEAAIEQEKNLCYVAVTRAKQRLVFVYLQ